MDYLIESSPRPLRELPLFSHFTDQEPEAHTAQGHMSGKEEQELNSGGLTHESETPFLPTSLAAVL